MARTSSLGGFTMGIRNVEAVKLRLFAYPVRLRNRAKAIALNALDDTFAIAQDLCPRDTHYMAEHMVGELTPSGLGYRVGFRATDFIGRLNPVSGIIITEFYPYIQEYGTGTRTAQPSIHPADDIVRPRYRRELRAALTLAKVA